jgi:hypothetical protein
MKKPNLIIVILLFLLGLALGLNWTDFIDGLNGRLQQ